MKIFISYRRDDSEETTGRIYDCLVDRFSTSSVFRDIDSIPLKTEFAEYIKSWIQGASIVIVVIGTKWLDASDEQGNLRLEDPKDYVRIEITTALSLGVPIIPVTVQNADLPKKEVLPEAIQSLVDWNSLAVRPDPDFHSDMKRLVRALRTPRPSEQGQDSRHDNDSRRPDKGLNNDQVKLLMTLYVKTHRLSIHKTAYEYSCVRVGPDGRYWGYEYTPPYIEMTKDEDLPKKNPPDARIERLRWLGAFEELCRRGMLQNVKKGVFELSDTGKRVGYELLGWMKKYDPGAVPQIGIFG